MAVYLNRLDPNAASVELYSDGVNGHNPVPQKMERVLKLTGEAGGYAYGGLSISMVAADRL